VACSSKGDLALCNAFHSGLTELDADAQAWRNNCTVTACPTNSVRHAFVYSEPQGCNCMTGCDAPATCPANADAAKDQSSGGLACACLPGFVGVRDWVVQSSQYNHSCVQTECSAGSERGKNTLCDCLVGFNGSLAWDVNKHRYLGACAAAECPTPGVNCSDTTNPAKRAQPTVLDCLPG